MDETVAAALSALDAEDPAVAADAVHAWEKLCEISPPEGPTQASVQHLCWAALRDEHEDDPDRAWAQCCALAELLRRLGRARYAAIARSETTRRLIFTTDPDEWSEAYRTSLEASGVEPPDTDEVTWQHMCTSDELAIVEQIASTLEVAAVAGEFGTGERKSETAARRAQLTHAVLTTERKGQSLLEAVLDCRIDLWSSLSETRAAMYEGLLDGLHSAAVVPHRVARRVHRFLAQLGDGTVVLPDGALPREFNQVIEDSEPDTPVGEPWWSEPHTSTGEQVIELWKLLQRMRIVRRVRGRLVPAARVRDAGADEALRILLRDWLGSGYTAETIAAEALLAVIARGQGMTFDPAGPVTHDDDVDPTILAATILADEGWTTDGDDIEPYSVAPLVERAIGDLRVLGVVTKPGLAPGALTDDVVTFSLGVLRQRLLHARFPIHTRFRQW
ncbi:hypothetical protein ONR57_05895 [Hoyosella sp. YIM 151337]|uniref:hypothetical protein n=1 Tax=Hoyosella sp. YIM 151337 TaxID=2992742 RepID=UPI002235DF5A|nr:hypothetical protein [Hoyosella sp. YIM 151337]MCW4352828.1 hypothetical protein [Hoyosella sp. YIM 151337]